MEIPWLDILGSEKVETRYSNIRERALREQARRINAELVSRGRGLSSSSVAGRLSPLSKLSSETLRSYQRKTRDDLTFVEQQNAAARSEREDFNKLTPLQRSHKVRSDLYRSEKDRIDAIAGMLERERLQRKKLSRDQFDRVQARAAARIRHHRGRDAKFAGVDVYLDKKATSKEEVRRRDKVIEKITGKHKWCEGKELRREVLAAAGFPKRPHRPKVRIFAHGADFEKYEQRKAMNKLIRCL